MLQNLGYIELIAYFCGSIAYLIETNDKNYEKNPNGNDGMRFDRHSESTKRVAGYPP